MKARLGAPVPLRLVHAVGFVACAVAVAGPTAGSAEGKSSCRKVVVHATDSSTNLKEPAAVRLHRCDRLRIEFVFLTQDQLVYLWQVTHKPSKKVLKDLWQGYGPSTAETGTQVWTYRAVGKGKTSVTFGDYTPSYPNQPAASTYKVTVTVR